MEKPLNQLIDEVREIDTSDLSGNAAGAAEEYHRAACDVLIPALQEADCALKAAEQCGDVNAAAARLKIRALLGEK